MMLYVIVMIGYKTEELYGDGERDLLRIINYEINELGNDHYDVELCVESYLNGYTDALWLCDSPEQLIEAYELEPDTHIDKYTLNDYVVICDMGYQGKLIAFKEK